MPSAKQLLASTISAQNQMQFQERMSSTAHTREVADLQNAGLNPVLSARLGGASTPSGAAGDYSDPETNAIMGALKTAQISAGTSAKAVEGLSGDLKEFMEQTNQTLSYFLNNFTTEFPKAVDFYHGKNADWQFPESLRNLLNNVNFDPSGLFNRLTGNKSAKLFKDGTGKTNGNGSGLGDLLKTYTENMEKNTRSTRGWLSPLAHVAYLLTSGQKGKGNVSSAYNSAKGLFNGLLSSLKGSGSKVKAGAKNAKNSVKSGLKTIWNKTSPNWAKIK